MDYLEKLIEAASDELRKESPLLPSDSSLANCKLIRDLFNILERKNGFFAFESALHFFPSGEVKEGYSLEEWNSLNSWRKHYNNLTEDLWFFAQDAFGEQFAINLRDEIICRFNPETADCEKMAVNFQGWARIILEDYNAETGYQLIHEWQALYGVLPTGYRLVPQRPFVLGGQFDINNLISMDSAEGMIQRAEIAVQIHELPDGTNIKITFNE